MSNAFAPIVRARPNPIFGRPVHQGSPPIDYSPILLLKPFGFRIAPDTLSSDENLVGQRGITPAFGYSAPHPSAGGTLTPLIHALPSAHYGQLPTRTYYNGISGAGNEGMGQLMHFGDEYDGFLIGAPVFYWDQFTLADAWPYVVFKKLVQQGGTIPTDGQETALGAAVLAACDGLDGVVDSIIDDPR